MSRPESPDDGYGLSSKEMFWRDHYDWLNEKGYSLRSRYKPDWKRSWIGTSKHPMECDDGLVLIASSYFAFPCRLD